MFSWVYYCYLLRTDGHLIRSINVGYLFLAVFFIILCSLKVCEDDSFPDTNMYANWFNYAKVHGFVRELKDFGFDLLIVIISSFASLKVFFITITAIIFLLIYFIGRKVSKTYYYIFMMFSISSIYSFTLLTSLLRQEIALLLVVFSLFFKNKYVKYLVMISAIFFHKSAIILVLSVLFIHVFPKLKFNFFLLFWLLCFAVGFIFKGSYLEWFSYLNYDKRVHYIVDTDPTSEYYTPKVFRLDFLIVSVLIIINSSFFIYFRKVENQLYISISKLFVFANAIWLFLMFSNHTIRFVLLSWSLLPVIMIIQIIYDKKLNTNLIFADAYLSFSIFNLMIYLT